MVNKFLLAGVKFMPEIHLRQPEYIYSACRPFTKNKEKIQKFRETGDSRYIYQSELDKACFQHDMADGYFIYLEEQFLIKYCMIKHLILVKIQHMMDIKEILLQWSINFLIKYLVRLQINKLLVGILN